MFDAAKFCYNLLHQILLPRLFFLLTPTPTRPPLHLPHNLRIHQILRNIRRNALLPITPPFRRHKNIQIPRHHKRRQHRQNHDVRQYETKDIRWVVPQGVELRVAEAVDYCEDGGGDEAEEEGPEGGDAPVFAGCDDGV